MHPTLIDRIKRTPAVRRVAAAFGLVAPSKANPDHYHGDVARDYLDKRLKQKYWHVEQQVVRDLLRKLPRGCGVLDVPVGTGRFVEMCHDCDMTVTGLDISQDMLDVARQTLGDERYQRCRMIRGSAEEMPFNDAEFDIVICFRFFGLIPLDLSRRVMGELRRVARRWVVIRIPVRKDSAPPPPPLLGTEAVGGRIYEREVIGMFAAHGLLVQERHCVEERDDVSYLVYLLNVRDATG
jgi:SAM-dependent methyltransferase